MGLDMTLYNAKGDEIYYWRKAYQIHNYLFYLATDEEYEWGDYTEMDKDWFPEYVTLDLDRKHLEKLLNLCEVVLKDRSKASELLPTDKCRSYDDTYYEALENIVKELPSILNNFTYEEEFTYHTC